MAEGASGAALVEVLSTILDVSLAHRLPWGYQLMVAGEILGETMTRKHAIVSYILGGRGVATRHLEGCGTLDLARKQSQGEAPRGVSVTKLEVWSEEQYDLLPSYYPAWKNHSCVLNAAEKQPVQGSLS